MAIVFKTKVSILAVMLKKSSFKCFTVVLNCLTDFFVQNLRSHACNFLVLLAHDAEF
jgi:hypothetical protein